MKKLPTFKASNSNYLRPLLIIFACLGSVLIIVVATHIHEVTSLFSSPSKLVTASTPSSNNAPDQQTQNSAPAITNNSPTSAGTNGNSTIQTDNSSQLHDSLCADERSNELSESSALHSAFSHYVETTFADINKYNNGTDGMTASGINGYIDSANQNLASSYQSFYNNLTSSYQGCPITLKAPPTLPPFSPDSTWPETDYPS